MLTVVICLLLIILFLGILTGCLALAGANKRNDIRLTDEEWQLIQEQEDSEQHARADARVENATLLSK